MSNTNFTVYEHVNKINGKKYIGLTGRDVQRRWRPDGSGYKQNVHFWNAIQKYGWDGFEHNIIKTNLTKEEACALEVELIARNESNNPDKGYNVSDGGEHNNMPQATRERLSRMRKGTQLGSANPNYGNHKLAGENNPNYGKHWSAEVRAKMSAGRKGKGLHKFSEEHKQKIRENHSGGADKKKVLCVETGIVYESINAAARAVNASKKLISNCCRDVSHYNTGKGYHWKFINEV